VKRRMAQPLFVLSVAVTLVLTLSVVVLSAQFQPIVPDIGFEIEGNTALDQGGEFDWENSLPPAVRIPDPNSKITTDPTTFKPNSKFDYPEGWSIMPGKVGPGQSELVNFLVWDIQPGDLSGGRPNDHWLVLGMERIKTPGFFELDFEYNQAAWDGSSGGLTRTPGDVLVGFELRGKPTSKRAENKVLLLQYWPGAQPSLCSTTPGPGGEPELVEVGSDPCPPYGGSGWYYRLLADDALSAESGLVQATMNKEPFAPSWPSIDGNGNPCDVIGPYQFAEAAINLTALGIDASCGSVHAKSRSAPHVHSDLKDLVGPVPLECTARLDGHKFKDENGDGLWDPDEPPLEGWEIRLSDGSVAHTDAEGYYAFEDLDYGTYTVSEVCPQDEDWVQTAPTPNDPNSCGEAVYTVTLDSCNPEAKDLDFGNRPLPPARLDGHKFHDIYGDGLDPDDPPLEGWEIRLSDGSVTHTDAEGYYAFEDLDYGTYTVSEVCPQGEDWIQTAPIPDDPNSCGEAVHTVTLDGCNPEAKDLDFGNLPLPRARLYGHKFRDAADDSGLPNGIWDPWEPPIAGWEIRLSDGSVAHTDSDGYYAFEDLAYGTYTVSEVCPVGEGWWQTAPGFTDDITCGDAVYTVTLDSDNREAKDLNFGNHLPDVRLDGHKFEDKNGDGLWGPDEPPLEGWEIRLSDGSVTHTNAEGYYAFEDLDYGTYTVSEVCPPFEGWMQTAPTPDDPNSCGEAVYTVELDSGNPEVTDLDFGNLGQVVVLEPSKDVQTSFTRTYLWTLEKMVDNPGPILLYPGDYAEVNYTVKADSAYVDSDWAVEGTITIGNPLGEDALLASVTDVITPGDIPVPVECEEWRVPAQGSVTCTYGPVPLPDGSDRTNTVTVMAHDSAEEFTATAPIVFDQPTTEIDEEARVTDTNWADEQWEGPEGFDVGYGDTPWEKPYDWKIWAPEAECGLFDVPNTATLVTNDTGTELTAGANVQIFEVCPTLAYEDLPLILGNDWDYNDLVIEIPIYLDVSDDGDLLAASFEIWQTTRLTAFTHAFNLQPYAEYFTCSGQYTKTVTVDGVVTTETGLYNPGDNFLLIPDTGMPRDLVELTIKFDVTASGACPRDFGNPDPINQYHGEWLFFDPWLTVYPRADLGWDPYEVHVIQPPEDPEPRILTVPVAWSPPPEKVPIWDVYPCVQEGNPPIFMPYWWDTALCMP